MFILSFYKYPGHRIREPTLFVTFWTIHIFLKQIHNCGSVKDYGTNNIWPSGHSSIKTSGASCKMIVVQMNRKIKDL